MAILASSPLLDRLWPSYPVHVGGPLLRLGPLDGLRGERSFDVQYIHMALCEGVAATHIHNDEIRVGRFQALVHIPAICLKCEHFLEVLDSISDWPQPFLSHVSSWFFLLASESAGRTARTRKSRGSRW
jgi:hypothetical protein